MGRWPYSGISSAFIRHWNWKWFEQTASNSKYAAHILKRIGISRNLSRTLWSVERASPDPIAPRFCTGCIVGCKNQTSWPWIMCDILARIAVQRAFLARRCVHSEALLNILCKPAFVSAVGKRRTRWMLKRKEARFILLDAHVNCNGIWQPCQALRLRQKATTFYGETFMCSCMRVPFGGQAQFWKPSYSPPYSSFWHHREALHPRKTKNKMLLSEEKNNFISLLFQLGVLINDKKCNSEILPLEKPSEMLGRLKVLINEEIKFDSEISNFWNFFIQNFRENISFSAKVYGLLYCNTCYGHISKLLL